MKNISLICLSILITALLAFGCSSSKKLPTANKSSVQTYSVQAPKSGKLVGLIAEKGERISKDQPLFAIADEVLNQQLNKTATELATAEAKLKAMENGIAEPSISVNLQPLQARLQAAQDKFRKLNQLLAIGGASRVQVQAAQKELEDANQAVLNAQKQTNIVKVASPEELELQKKRIASFKEQMQLLLKKQEENEVLCPATGIIKELKFANGAEVKAGETIIILEATKE